MWGGGGGFISLTRGRVVRAFFVVSVCMHVWYI